MSEPRMPRKRKTFKQLIRDAMKSKKSKKQKQEDYKKKIQKATGYGAFTKVDII